MAKTDDLKNFKQEVLDHFTDLKQDSASDCLIDDLDLDGESIKTPKLHNKWLMVMADEAYMLKQLLNKQKKMYLERWKYWNGKQTDKYYADYGVPHEKIMKTDIDKYLNSDDFIIEMSEIVEAQSQIVSFCEKTVKEISSRGFHIKAAIDWRKFQAGS